MRKLIAVLLLLLLPAMGMGMGSVDPPSPVVKLTSTATQCSGVAIAPAHVYLTAAHCIGADDDKTAWVNESIRVTLIVADPVLDIAVFKGIGTSGSTPILRLGDRPTSGHEVRIYGFGMNAPEVLIFRELFMNEFVPPGGTEPVGFLSGAVPPGMSGGPVVDRDGEVVGLMLGTYDFPMRAIGYMTPYDDFIRFARKYAR